MILSRLSFVFAVVNSGLIDYGPIFGIGADIEPLSACPLVLTLSIDIVFEQAVIWSISTLAYPTFSMRALNDAKLTNSNVCSIVKMIPCALPDVSVM